MDQYGYDLLAKEYYEDVHKTCRNFDTATKDALATSSITIPATGLVLEVGCGRGRCTEFLSIPSKRIIQLDSSREMLALMNRETCLLRVHANATAIPLYDRQFNAIIGFLIDPFIGLNFFSEAFRLLGPGGLFLATTPTVEWGHALRGNKDPEASYARFITKNNKEVNVPSMLIEKGKIKDMLEFTGFREVIINQHSLPQGTTIISPDIRKVADGENIDVFTLPIIYLIQATKP
jgi:SAM-dependent methyltransferase